MKKCTYFAIIFVIVNFVLINNINAQGKLIFSPKIYLDVSGTHNVSALGSKGDLGVNSAPSLGMELLGNNNQLIKIGGGIMYLFPREQEISGSGNFNFVPVYGIIKLDILESGDLIPALVGNIGYNMVFDGDEKYRGDASLNGGLYLGGGIRLQTKRVFFEGMYKSFNGSVSLGFEGNSLEIDINYTTLSISAGLYL